MGVWGNVGNERFLFFGGVTHSSSVDGGCNRIVRLGGDSVAFNILMSDCVLLKLLEQGCGDA